MDKKGADAEIMGHGEQMAVDGERVDHVGIDRAFVRPSLGFLSHVAQCAHPRQFAEPFRQAPAEVGRVAAGKRGQQLVVQRVIGDVLHVDRDAGMRLLVGGDLLLGGDPVRLLGILGDPEMQRHRIGDHGSGKAAHGGERRRHKPCLQPCHRNVLLDVFLSSRAAVEGGASPTSDGRRIAGVRLALADARGAQLLD
jgi:hypothetical protein